MKYLNLFILMLLPVFLLAQDEPRFETTSLIHPYGQKNIDAPDELDDFAFMIGTCHCKSLQRDAQGNWKDTVTMYWSAEYVLDGLAILDHIWKSDGQHSMNMRQWDDKNKEWVVSFYSTNISNNFDPWKGNKQGNDIVLKKPFTTSTGLEGSSTLRFYNISDTKYDWKGEWISTDGSITYPFGSIWCEKM